MDTHVPRMTDSVVEVATDVPEVLVLTNSSESEFGRRGVTGVVRASEMD